jgi:hypothetical protein
MRILQRGSACRPIVRLLVAGTLSAALAPAPAAAVGPPAGSRTPPPPPAAPLPDLPELPDLEALRASRFGELALLARGKEGWFGIGMRCSDCTLAADDSTGTAMWQFRSAPEVYSVDADGPADRAGVEPGDVITHVDGVPVTTVEGGRRWGAVRPGDKVKWTVSRHGKSRILSLTAGKRPEHDFTFYESDARRQLDRARREVARERERVSRELARLHGRDLDPQTRESIERQLEAVQRSLAETERSLHEGRFGLGVLTPPPAPPTPPAAPVAPVPPASGRRRLRYEGAIGGSHVEVRGSSAVVVTEDAADGELVITTPEATIRIREQKPGGK